MVKANVRFRVCLVVVTVAKKSTTFSSHCIGRVVASGAIQSGETPMTSWAPREYKWMLCNILLTKLHTIVLTEDFTTELESHDVRQMHLTCHVSWDTLHYNSYKANCCSSSLSNIRYIELHLVGTAWEEAVGGGEFCVKPASPRDASWPSLYDWRGLQSYFLTQWLPWWPCDRESCRPRPTASQATRCRACVMQPMPTKPTSHCL